MTERQPEKTPKDKITPTQAELSIRETTTDESRTRNTFTYELFTRVAGLVIVTSRRTTREMPAPTEANPNAKVETEMEEIAAFGGSESEASRDTVRLTREFIPPLRTADERIFVAMQMGSTVAGTLVLSRDLIASAVAPGEATSSDRPDAQPPATPPQD